jgi:colanic acid/amylovoran biosynthesis glycosyltransferase
MPQNIRLFTASYPYGHGENFLDDELPILAKYFTTITIQPMTFGGNLVPRQVPVDVRVLLPIMPISKTRKIAIGIRDIFRFRHLRKDFYRNKIFCSFAKFRLYIVAVDLIHYWKKRKFEKTNDEIFYFYWGIGACYIIPFLNNSNKNRVIIRLHGNDLYEYLSNNYIPLRGEIYSKADILCPVSEYGRQYLNSRYPQFAHKITLARLGTRDCCMGPCTPIPHHLTIVTCCYLVPLKRIHVLAESLKQLDSNAMHITWHHFGDGPELKNIETIISEFPRHISAILHGRCSNKNIFDFYATQHIDAFISVSETEGVPVSVMEATSFGIPVIATNVGGTSEILHPEGAIKLAADFTHKELIDAIMKVTALSCSREIRQKIRRNWQEKASAEINYKLFAEKIILSKDHGSCVA